MRHTRSRGAAVWFVLALGGGARAQCELEFLSPHVPDATDQFGWSISVSGERVLVGSPFADRVGPDSGTAWIYDRVGDAWVQTAELLPSSGGPGDWYGTAVSLSGDLAVVGGEFTSAATVFARVGASWVEVAELLPADPPADGFGRTVAVDGDTVFVGAFADDDIAPNAGSAYVFEDSPSGWVESVELKVATASATDWVGTSVAVSGDWALLGAPGDDVATTNGGAVYVHERTPAGWVQRARLEPSDPEPFALFGEKLDLDGTRAIVGAWGQDEVGIDSGAAYVYERVGTTWVELQKLLPDDGRADDRFGFSVAIAGDVAAVGAYLQEAGSFDQGAVYLFEFDGAGWNQSAKLTAGDGALGDYFGSSVSLSGQRLAVGARLADAPYTASGAGYVFSTGGEPCSPLFTAPDEISLAAGGTQHMALDAGTAHAFELYFVLGSVSGTTPGLVVDGHALPLNFDAYYLFLALHPNLLVANSLSLLDGAGRAHAALSLPNDLGRDLVGVTLHHAYVTLTFVPDALVTLTSNAEPLVLVP